MHSSMSARPPQYFEVLNKDHQHLKRDLMRLSRNTHIDAA
jgi:hypothetical protein